MNMFMWQRPIPKAQGITKISKPRIIIGRMRSAFKAHVIFKSLVLSVEKKLLSYTKILLVIFYVSIPHDFIYLKMVEGVAFINADPKQHVLLSSRFSFTRILF